MAGQGWLGSTQTTQADAAARILRALRIAAGRQTPDAQARTLTRCLRAQTDVHRSRQEMQFLSAITIQRTQRGACARETVVRKRARARRHRAAGRIQRQIFRWQGKRHSAALDALSEQSVTCGRCATSQSLVHVFDLQETLCEQCVATTAKTVTCKKAFLRPHGEYLGTMIRMRQKQDLDAHALRLQACWRRHRASAFTRDGTMCVSCHQPATHVDQKSRRYLCGRCANHVRRFKSGDSLGRCRVKTLSQFKANVWAAYVIRTYWRSWRASKDWRLIKEAAAAQATKAARVVQKQFRGSVLRTLLCAHAKTLAWLCRAALPLLRRRPGQWFVRLRGILLVHVSSYLVGNQFRGFPPGLGHRAAIGLLHDAIAQLATRIGRGAVARRRTGTLRRQVRQKQLEEARARRCLITNAAVLIQRVQRGVSTRCKFITWFRCRTYAKEVAKHACDIRARTSDVVKSWSVHGGFLGCVQLTASCFVATSRGFGLTAEWAPLCARRMSRPDIFADSLVAGSMLFRADIATESSQVEAIDYKLYRHRQRRISDTKRFLWFGCESNFPCVMSLHIVSATLDCDLASMRSCSVITHWCQTAPGKPRRLPALKYVGSGSPEGQNTIYICCDSARNPEHFGPCAKKSTLRFILYKKSSSSPNRLSHAISVSLESLLTSLGARTTFGSRLRGPREEQVISRGDLFTTVKTTRHASISVLLTRQTRARTEAQSVVSNVLLDLVEELVHYVPKHAPHIECTLISFAPSRVVALGSWLLSRRQRGVRTRLNWNESIAGETRVSIVSARSQARQSSGGPVESFILPTNISRYKSSRNNDAMKLRLGIELVRGIGGSPYGLASLDEGCLGAGETNRDIFVQIRPWGCDAASAENAVVLGCLHLRLAVHHLLMPHWRKRLRPVESFVRRAIDSALCLVPRPRIEIMVETITGLLPEIDISTLECRATWGRCIAVTWFVKAGASGCTCSSSQIWAASGRRVALPLPSRGFSVPELQLEIYGILHSGEATESEKCCLGACYLDGLELAASSGFRSFNLVEPRSRRYCSLTGQVTRLVPGHITMFVEPFDLPPCMHGTLDSSLCTLRLAILDLDLAHYGTKSVTSQRPLPTESNPYAVVKWQGHEIGLEEIARPSLTSLRCLSALKNARLASVDNRLPHRSQLYFSGQPYVFRILSKGPELSIQAESAPQSSTDITVDVFATKQEHEMCVRDKLIGQAVLDGLMPEDIPVSYCALPLRRRRRDTLHSAFVHFRLNRRVGTELLVSSLIFTGHHFQSGCCRSTFFLQVCLDVMQRGRSLSRRVYQSKVRGGIGGQARWPRHRDIAVTLPSSVALPGQDSVLRITVSCGVRVLQEIGSTEQSLRPLLAAHCGHRPRLSKCNVARCLEQNGSGTSASVDFLLSAQQKKTWAAVRSLDVDSFPASPKRVACTSQTVTGDTAKRVNSQETNFSLTSAHASGCESSRVEWSNVGGDHTQQAAVTMRIVEAELLNQHLQIDVCSGGTNIGHATCKLERVVEAMQTSSPECRFPSINIGQSDKSEIKQFSFTTWLERCRYFRMSVHDLHIMFPLGRPDKRNTEARVSCLAFSHGGATCRTSNTANAQWDPRTLYLPATARTLQRCPLKIDLWYSDAMSSVRVATASTTLDLLLAKTFFGVPIHFTLPLASRGPRGQLISFTLTCSELTPRLRQSDPAPVLPLVFQAATLPLPQQAALRLWGLRFQRASNSLKKNALETYCTVALGPQICRTTIKPMVRGACDWKGQTILIDANFDALMGKLLQVRVVGKPLHERDHVVGCARLHLALERCVSHCNNMLKYQGRIANPLSPGPVVLQLKEGDLDGTISFEFDILTKGELAGYRTQTGTGPIGFRAGQIFYAPMVPLDDDELTLRHCNIMSGRNNKITSNWTSDLVDDTRFLVGNFDDHAASADARRRCQFLSSHDRNELHVIVLRAWGLPQFAPPCTPGAALGPPRLFRRHSMSRVQLNDNADRLVRLRVTNSVASKGPITRMAVSTLTPEWGEQFILPTSNLDAPPKLEIVVEDCGVGAIRRAFVELAESALPGFGAGRTCRCWSQLGGEFGAATSSSVSTKKPIFPGPFGALQLAMRWTYNPALGCSNARSHECAAPNELHFGLLRARGLRAVGLSGIVANIRVLSSVGMVTDFVETGVVMGLSNPVWNAVFSFEVACSEPQRRSASMILDISIEHWNVLSDTDTLGRALVPLSSFDGRAHPRQWFVLSEHVITGETARSCGEIELAAGWVHNPNLTHTSAKFPGKLKVTLVRARGLRLPEYSLVGATGDVHPFVRLSIGDDSWDSKSFSRNSHPVWHETCAIPLHACDVTHARLVLALAGGCASFQMGTELKLSALFSHQAAKASGPLRSWLPLACSALPTSCARSRDLESRPSLDTHAHTLSRSIMPRPLKKSSGISSGEIEVVLTWSPNSAQNPIDADGTPSLLHVEIIRARALSRPLNLLSRDLTFGNIGGTCDPYVVIKRHGQQLACSSVLFQTWDPVWHETFKTPIRTDPDGSCLDMRCGQITLEIFHCGRSEVDCELVGYCSVDITTELCHRRAVRSWRKLHEFPESRKYPHPRGEIEVEFRWVCEEPRSEPAFKLHFRNMSAAILRSPSDTVLDGAARLGIHANYIKFTPNGSDHVLAEDNTRVCVQLRILRATHPVSLKDERSHPFIVVRCNNREIHRTAAQYLTSIPTWMHDKSLACAQISIAEAQRSHNVSVELWAAGVDFSRNYMGGVALTSKQLLDERLQGQEWQYALKGGVGTFEHAKLTLMWNTLQQAGEVACVKLQDADEVHPVESPGGASNDFFPRAADNTYEIHVMDLKIAQLGSSASSVLVDQKLCLSASLGDSTTSLMGPATEFRLLVRGRCWRGTTIEQLHLRVSSQGKHGSCYGDCIIPLQAHWINDGIPHRILQMLSHPEYDGLHGYVMGSLKIASRRPELLASLSELARDEHERVICALERSAARAKRTARDAGYAVERATSSKARAALRRSITTYHREAARATRRLEAARDLSSDMFHGRAELRLASLNADFKSTVGLAPRSDFIPQQETHANFTLESLVLEASTLTVKQRELAHVAIDIRVDPAKSLGIIWGNVDDDETVALAANQSGFSKIMPSTTPHAQNLAAKAAGMLTTTPQISPAELKRAVKESARNLAGTAGRDLAVLGLRTTGEAARLGVRLGWRAVAMDGAILSSRESLVRALESKLSQKVAVLTFTRRVEWRYEHMLKAPKCTDRICGLCGAAFCVETKSNEEQLRGQDQ